MTVVLLVGVLLVVVRVTALGQSVPDRVPAPDDLASTNVSDKIAC